MKKFSLRNFLIRHHGPIDKIYLSYEDTGKDIAELSAAENDNWFERINKEFDISMDLQHTAQTIDDFTVLKPYLDLEVTNWDLFPEGTVKYTYGEKEFERPKMILDVSLDD